MYHGLYVLSEILKVPVFFKKVAQQECYCVFRCYLSDCIELY